MTHEVEEADGNVHDEWAELGPAEEIPSEQLPEVPVGSQEAVPADYDPAVVLSTVSTMGQ